VEDKDLGLKLKIIDNQCPFVFIGTEQSAHSDASKIRVSYKAFQFIGADETAVHVIRCSVSHTIFYGYIPKRLAFFKKKNFFSLFFLKERKNKQAENYYNIFD